MENTLVFKIPVPPDRLLGRLSWGEISGPEALVEALSDHWKCDVVSELTECCCDSTIPWSEKRRIAEILWSLDSDRYFDAGVPCHMLTSEVPGLSHPEAIQMLSLLREQAPRFLNGLLRSYHKTFLTLALHELQWSPLPKYIPPIRVLSAADGSASGGPAADDGSAVRNFVDAILPRLDSDELVRGAIEMASMRHFPGDTSDIGALDDWVVARANESKDAAFHYIMFAGDAFPARYNANVARDLAIRILRATGEDHFERLLALSDTDNLDTLSGVMRTFGSFGDERAVPFLVSRLRDDRKAQRAQAVSALGEIGSPEALSAIKAIANDKRKVVRKAVEQALGRA